MTSDCCVLSHLSHLQSQVLRCGTLFGSHSDYQFRPIRMTSHLNEIRREQTFVKIPLIPHHNLDHNPLNPVVMNERGFHSDGISFWQAIL